MQNEMKANRAPAASDEPGEARMNDFADVDESESAAIGGPIEVNIITGFLGAGKTTLINKLLAEGYGGSGTALLENEFGDVAIDSDLVADSNIAVRTMTTGCICCTLRGDFITNLTDIVRRYSPRRIIIEPTGLANLADILDLCYQAANTLPLRLNAVITVASAENLMPLIMVGGDFFVEQLDQARFFLVSCSQLVDDEDLEDTLACLREHARATTPILCGDWADISALEIMTAAEQAWHDWEESSGDAYAADEEHVGHDAGNSVGRCGDSEHDHDHAPDHHDDHAHGHDHGHSHFDEATGCTSFAFTPSRAFTEDDLTALTNLITSNKMGTVFRAKGFLAGTSTTILYEYVYGRARWGESDYRGSAKFVVIGRDLDSSGFSSFLGDDAK